MVPPMITKTMTKTSRAVKSLRLTLVANPLRTCPRIRRLAYKLLLAGYDACGFGGKRPGLIQVRAATAPERRGPSVDEPHLSIGVALLGGVSSGAMQIE
jgi:hypothetical protein